VGVGAGEAGAIPPSQSLIADYVASSARARAIAFFMLSATAGYLIAFVGGSAIAASHGWRTALIAVGLPGVLLAVLAYVSLDEPRERLAVTAGARGPAPGVREALGRLAAKRSYVLVLVGAGCFGLVAYGAFIFIPSFLVRSMGVSLDQVGATYGLLSAVATLASTLLGGWLADKAATRDVRWYAWVPALACALALPFLVAALLAHSLTAFLVLSTIGGLSIGAGVPSMFTALHAVCGSSRRTVAVALMTFTLSLVGSGFGPLITGLLSDLFAARHGVESLRYAMVGCTLFLAPAAWAFYRCGFAMPREVEA